MPETNGQQDNLSRLDRIEIVIEHIVGEHEKLVDEHRRFLRAQVVMVDSIDKLTGKLAATDERLGLRIDEIGGKLDALIDVVDRNSREYHERLTRLENRQ